MGLGRSNEVSDAVRRELWRLAIGMCYRCREELDPSTKGKTPTAHVAHMVALSDHGPRADSGTSVSDRNAVENLLLLCPSCHDVIDKSEGKGFSLAQLHELKRSHEVWTAALRQSGRAWKIRYSMVDYLNLPRMAMRSGGIELLSAARDVGLDPDVPFRSQRGIGPGLFVGRVRTIFETWSVRATPLNQTTSESIRLGMDVSFDALMTMTKTLVASPWQPDEPSRIQPYLNFMLGRRRVTIRFNPAWLTTMTAEVTLDDAAKQPTGYAGMGTVVGVTEDEIRLSALMFGQPMSEAGAFHQLMTAGDLDSLRTVDMEDLVDEFSGQANAVPQRRIVSRDSSERLDVALHFDDLRLQPDQSQNAVVRGLLRVVPEFRRDLLVAAVADLPTYQLKEAGLSTAAIAARMISAKPEQWKTLSLPRLVTLMKSTEISLVVVRRLSPDQAQDLHDLLSSDDSLPYLGAVEIVPGDSVHEGLYSAPPHYRLLGSSLHLLYSAADYGPTWDQRPHDRLEEWQQGGLFQEVEWEEDQKQSAEDEAFAAEAMEGWLRSLDVLPGDEP